MRKIGLLMFIICITLELAGCLKMGLSGTESAIAGQKTIEELQILVSSDVHGRYMPYDYGKKKKDTKGSLTQMYTAIKKIRTDKSILIVENDDKARSLIEIKLELKPTNNGRYSVVESESNDIMIRDYKSDKGLEKVLEKAHNKAKD